MRKSIIFILLVLITVAALPANAQQIQPTPVPSGSQEASPAVAPELFNKGSAALQSGDYQQALLNYSLFLMVNPTDSQGFLARGFANQYLGEIDNALDDLTQALNFAPPETEYAARAYQTRADVYLQKNNVESALADLNASLEIMPNSPEALGTRASIFIFQQRFDDALADYTQVIELQPNAPVAYNQRGDLNRQIGNLDAALEDFNQSLQLDPNSVDAYFSRAMVYNSKAQYDEALDDLDTILSLNPDEIGVYLLRGRVNTTAEHREEAASDYLTWLDSIETRRISPTNDTPINEPFAIDMAPGWVYNFELTAEEGQVLNIEAVRLDNAEADPLVILVNSDRQPLIADDDSGGDFNSLIQDFVIPSEGQYTVIISHAGGGADGKVGIRIRLGE